MAEPSNHTKRRAAALSVSSNTLLVLSKLVIGILTGSVSVISEAIHSAMDLLAAIIAFIAVSFSDRPPDLDHPHGHGKIESLSGAVEALLIFAAVIFIVYEAIEKFIHGGKVEHLYLGSVVMGFSALVNIGVSWYLQRVGKKTDSEALLADAAHLRTDVYTSLGVLLGLVLVQITGQQWLDPVAALAVGVLITREAWQITRRSVGNLLDESLPETERQKVEQAIQQTGVIFHDLRSRKSGATRVIDLHLNVSPTSTVEQVHKLCDRIEESIKHEIPRAQVLIHPEPEVGLPDRQSLPEWVKQLLDQHQDLFITYSDIQAFANANGQGIAFRLRLKPSLSLRRIQEISEHLTQHILQHVPQAKVFIQPIVS